MSSPAHRVPSTDDLEALKILAKDQWWGKLTQWEQRFLDSLDRRESWSPTQQDIFDQIWKEVIVERRRDG